MYQTYVIDSYSNPDSENVSSVGRRTIVLLLILPIPGFPRVRLTPGFRATPVIDLEWHLCVYITTGINTWRTGARGCQFSRPALLQPWRPVIQCGCWIHIVGNLCEESCNS